MSYVSNFKFQIEIIIMVMVSVYVSEQRMPLDGRWHHLRNTETLPQTLGAISVRVLCLVTDQNQKPEHTNWCAPWAIQQVTMFSKT